MYKIIGADKNEYGPASVAELHQWIREGRANAQSLIRAEGATEWLPLGTFPEFAAALTAKQTADAASSQGYYPYPQTTSTTNGMAITGFVLSMLGIPCCMVGLFPLLGLIFSAVGLSQIHRNPSQGGKGLAKAGLIISVITLLIFIVCIVIAAMSDFADKINDL